MLFFSSNVIVWSFEVDHFENLKFIISGVYKSVFLFHFEEGFIFVQVESLEVLHWKWLGCSGFERKHKDHACFYLFYLLYFILLTLN